MDVPSFEPKGSQMVIYCEGFCPFWPFSVCDIGFPLPPVFLCCSSVYLNSRPNQIKKLKKLWWNVLLFFWCFMHLWCCCLALKPFPMIFRIHKVGGNIFRVPLDTGGDPEGVDLLSALAAGWPPWVNKKRVIFVSNASWSKDLDAKWMEEYP